MISVTDEDYLINSIKLLYPARKNVKIVNIWTDDSALRVICDIKKLTVEFEESGSKQQLHLFLKTPTCGNSFDFFLKCKFYEREQHVFEILIPQLQKYIDGDILPVHYFTTKLGTLVLEDLSVQGYKYEERGELWNLNECKPSLKALAELHAASHKLYRQNSKINTELFSYNYFLECIKGLVETWDPVVSELLKLNKEDLVLHKYTEIMSFYRTNFSEMTYHDFKFIVLNHGDCRKENVLCKYDEKGVVSGVKIVDFQTCWWSSPVHDFMYFLALSVEFDVVENHFEELLEWYLQHLNFRLQKIGLTNTYDKSNFMNDLKYADRVCFLNLILLCVIIGPYKNKQFEDSFHKTSDNTQQSSFLNLVHDETFSKKVMDWVKFYKKIYL